MENGLMKSQLPTNEIMSIGKAFAESGLFPDIKQAAQAIVKIQAGQEMGIAPFAAMTGIHLIQGKPTVGAGIIASRIKASGKYDYRVMELTEKNCSIDFYQGKENIGNSSFSIEDARKAQTKNTDKFPKNMLFARAISNGVKWFCPDVFSGPVYTAEEMNQVTEDAEAVVTNGSPKDVTMYNHSAIATNGKPLISNEEFKNLTDKITAGDLDAYKAAINSYSFEANQRAILNREYNNKVNSVITDPSDIDKQNKEPIPGHWYAKLEKCKTPEDVDELSLKHKETIMANSDLKKLFVDTKAKLRKATSKPLPF